MPERSQQQEIAADIATTSSSSTSTPKPTPKTANDTTVVRIVVLSDTHGLHHKIQLPRPLGDNHHDNNVLIHCGDFADRGSLSDVRSFRTWLQAQTQFSDRIVIAGNHDQSITSRTGGSRKDDNDQQHATKIDLQAEFAQAPGITFLQDDSILCAGNRLRVFGASWKTCEQDDYESLLLLPSLVVAQNDETTTSTTAKDDREIDIFLSHIPAYWPASHSRSVIPSGSLSLAKILFQNRIPISCGGHYHWARGLSQFDDNDANNSNNDKNRVSPGRNTTCWFINAANKLPTSSSAAADTQENDEELYPPVVIDYDTRHRRIVTIWGIAQDKVQRQRIPPFFSKQINK